MKSLETQHLTTPGPALDPSGARGPGVSSARQEPVLPGEPPKASPTQAEPGARGSADARLPDGYLLQNRYRIIGLLDVGGMSLVYKAQDLRFTNVTRVCVVKEMRNTASDPRVRQMMAQNFAREANILATLSHPTVVQVYDYFSEGDCSYLVLEYVDGKNLETVLAETQGFLPETQVVHWAIQICEVLTFLHSREPQPIIFRDLKPSNIMLDIHGRIRLVDFGIARVFQSGHRGTMVGTEGYSPPEQYRGSTEPGVDIYALGATMHHLLSKQDPRLEPPFSFQNRPIPESNPFVSRELVQVVERALKYDLGERFGSAEEMHRALLAVGATRGLGGASSARTPGVVQAEVQLLWRFACEDEVRSSPAIHNGVVYVGAYDNNLYALIADRGKFLWKYATDGSIGSSPCVADGRVFVGSADRSLYAIQIASGRIAWTCPTQDSVWSSPCVAFGHVFFGSDDRNVYAANVHNGRVAWMFLAEGRVRSSPSVGGQGVYIACEAGVVYELDISGKSRWRFRGQRGITSSPALSDDMVYVGCQDRNVYALDIRSGWSVWRYRTDAAVMSSPAVAQGLVLVGSADGYMYALDAENGHLVWRYGTEGQITSSPAVAEGAVVFGSVDKCIYCLDVKTGELRWRFQTDGEVTSSPRVSEGVIYVGSHDRNLYAISL